MKNSIQQLLTSKRFIVGITAVCSAIVVHFLGLEPEVADKFAEAITGTGIALIVGQSLSDAGKALTLPAGTDHKGRGDRR